MVHWFQRRRTRRHPTCGGRIYVVGDVHGRIDLLTDLCLRIDADRAAHARRTTLEVFLGDYVDRGPDSRAVIEFLRRRRPQSGSVLLRGNHEAMLATALRDPLALPLWLQSGGRETLMSYGVSPAGAGTELALWHELRRAVPAAHVEFLAGLWTHLTIADYFFVHAGIRPGVRLDRQREEDLLWIREPFLSWSQSFGKIIVHGHSPVSRPDIRKNRINIDTCAWATDILTCLVLDGDRVSFL